MFSEWIDEVVKAFSVCSLWWKWKCAAQILFQGWKSDAGVLNAAGSQMSASSGLSQMRRATLTRPRPLPGPLHPMTDWWRGREAWLSHPIGTVLRGQSIFNTSQKVSWDVHWNCIAAWLLPLPNFVFFPSLPFPSFLSPPLPSLPFPSTGVGSQEQSLKIPCTIISVSELAS